MKLAHSLYLTDNILLSKQLKKPIVTLFLYNFDFADEFHIGVDAYPEHGIVIQFLAEYVFRFGWEIL